MFHPDSLPDHLTGCLPEDHGVAMKLADGNSRAIERGVICATTSRRVRTDAQYTRSWPHTGVFERYGSVGE